MANDRENRTHHERCYANKGKVTSNHRPIAYLPLMWKLLTGICAEKIIDHLFQNMLLPNEQKDCKKETKGTTDQLLIDKAILPNCRRTCKGLQWTGLITRKPMIGCHTYG